jgi:cation:H+ antiporter
MDIALSLLGGLVLLVLGGEFLVRGAVRFAERMGLSPLLIGLTLVGFGTSTPELVTSVEAALEGSPGIAIGNIVGSNIANILLILGVSALIFPIAVSQSALKRDGVIMVGVALLLAVVSPLMVLGTFAGFVFVALLIAYLVYAYLQERSGVGGHTAAYERGEAAEDVSDFKDQEHARSAAADITIALLIAVAGLVAVVFGGGFLVDGAVKLAAAMGISETVIGLTIVAVGTSLPEMVTSVIAALKRHADVALGNVLGSNIYNVLGIGGVTALISPTAVPAEIIARDNLVMVGVSVLLLALAYTGYRIGRREGALLIAGYLGYVALIWPK